MDVTPICRQLVLPWPPSANAYWRHVGGRVLLSREARSYRTHAALVVRRVMLRRAARAAGEQERLVAVIAAHPPDRRQRDLDNLLKQSLDSLQAAGLLADDAQIDRLTIYREKPCAGGRLVVDIDALPPREE